MPLSVVERQASMPENIFAELVRDSAHAISRRYFIVNAGVAAKHEGRYTNTGIRIRQVHFSGSLEDALKSHNPKFVLGDIRQLSARQKYERMHKRLEPEKTLIISDGYAYVVGPPQNEAKIREILQFKNGFYGRLDCKLTRK